MSEFAYGEHLGGVAGGEPTPEALARIARHLADAIERTGHAAPVLDEQHESVVVDEGDVIVVDTEEPSLLPWWRSRRSLVAFAAAVVVIVTGVAIAVVSGGEDQTEIGPRQEEPVPSPPDASSDAAPSSDDTAPAETEPLIETFEGFWTSAGFDAVFDGEMYSLLVGDAVVDEGTFSTLADGITFRSGPSSTSCDPAAGGLWAYEFADENTVSLTFVSDECDLDRPVGPSATLTRVDPFEVP